MSDTPTHPVPQTRAQLAALIDHTLLRPEATAPEVRALAEEALELQVAAACVSPTMLQVAAEVLEGSEVALCAVVGFPSGAHMAATKAYEARICALHGAREVDMVVNLALVVDDAEQAVAAEIAAVRAALTDGELLKVIIEAAALTPAQRLWVCRVAESEGAQYVKTSTGFHPAGGASVEAVAQMREAVSPSIGVKASGGVRTTELALELIEAGATRIGASATRQILEGFEV